MAHSSYLIISCYRYVVLLYTKLQPYQKVKKKAVPLHAMEALWGRGGIAPTHSRPRNLTKRSANLLQHKMSEHTKVRTSVQQVLSIVGNYKVSPLT
jgi:hypothetical protein